MAIRVFSYKYAMHMEQCLFKLSSPVNKDSQKGLYQV